MPPSAAKQPLRVECHAGDLLLINTKLWWHRTEIAADGGDGASYGSSVSLARDWTWGAVGATPCGDDGMTNVDSQNGQNSFFETGHLSQILYLQEQSAQYYETMVNLVHKT